MNVGALLFHPSSLSLRLSARSTVQPHPHLISTTHIRPNPSNLAAGGSIRWWITSLGNPLQEHREEPKRGRGSRF
eukprot:36311-Rhodomonas_salina.2